ncbi:MAG TPA: hypothetical protein VGC49_02345 [Solirubrobacterales bacterium]
MLGPARYLLGVLEIALLVGFAWVGAARVRSRLLPRFEGAPAHLATAVVAAALLIWVAEVLGSVSLLKPVPYVLGVATVGGGIWALDRRVWRRGGVPSLSFALPRRPGRDRPGGRAPGSKASGLRNTPPLDAQPAGGVDLVTPVALLIAGIAVIHFAAGVKTRLSTGMTGFDSTWYHGPFAAGFFQSGNTIDLHFIAPQFLAWFYPANGEILHAVGMLAFGRDVLSPLLNLGWFAGCLVACWCIGRPYRVGAWSLALGAVALSLPALADQAGEARNDIVGIFFLLAAVAIALNAWATRDEGQRGLPSGALVVAGLAAGLAAGTKLNFLLPAAVLVVGLAAIQAWVSPAVAKSRAEPGGSERREARERRESRSSSALGAAWRALAAAGLAALAGGGYWYLRNLIHSGNPLPWIHHLGPISLPAPEQGLGGREAHSVLGYLTDGSVWSDWFLPGLHHGLWVLWPLLGVAALAGLILALLSSRGSFWSIYRQKEPRNGEVTSAAGVAPAGRGTAGSGSAPSGSGTPRSGRAPAAGGQPRSGSEPEPVLALAGLVGLATALAWLIAPTSASGPEGMPRGFESGLRYFAPALVLGLALLPTVPPLRRHLRSLPAGWLPFLPPGGRNGNHPPGVRSGPALGIAAMVVVVAVAVGYPVQRHYLQQRYSNPTFSTPGLDAAFAWARDVSGARIATTSTRQYPLFGTDLSNRVQFVGEERPHGGFEAAANCRRWRQELNAGQYDYVVTTRDRLEPAKPPFPPQAKWTEGPWATPILRKPPTVVFKLTGPLNPSSCAG